MEPKYKVGDRVKVEINFLITKVTQEANEPATYDMHHVGYGGELHLSLEEKDIVGPVSDEEDKEYYMYLNDEIKRLRDAERFLKYQAQFTPRYLVGEEGDKTCNKTRDGYWYTGFGYYTCSQCGHNIPADDIPPNTCPICGNTKTYWYDRGGFIHVLTDKKEEE